ncbi:uncharacterized protein LOC118755042, partial [Rhagoletis pomonella]|uniref:uncharacterized protein LOC118755042 n=1 Tax=Rhagoletis pomonella TaxID=28610 RepID=UPI00177C8CC9
MDRFVVRKDVPTGANTETDSGSESSSSDERKPETRRKFRTEWLATFSWLRNKNGECYCIACDTNLVSHYSHLKYHGSLKKHLRNVAKKKNKIQIKQCLKTDQASFKKKVYHAELNLTMFCIQHNLSFLLMDFLPQLLSEYCPDSKIAAALKCGRTKSKVLTDVLGAKAKENIVSVLQTTKFSCIIDETTDVSRKKSLVIV